MSDKNKSAKLIYDYSELEQSIIDTGEEFKDRAINYIVNFIKIFQTLGIYKRHFIELPSIIKDLESNHFDSFVLREITSKKGQLTKVDLENLRSKTMGDLGSFIAMMAFTEYDATIFDRNFNIVNYSQFYGISTNFETFSYNDATSYIDELMNANKVVN